MIGQMTDGEGTPITDTRHPAMAFSFPAGLLPQQPVEGSIIRKNVEP